MSFIKNLSRSILLVALYSNISFAQTAPEFIFGVQATGINATPASSWNFNYGPEGNLNTTRNVTGNVSATSMISHMKVSISAGLTEEGVNMGEVSRVTLYARGAGSVNYTYSLSGTASVTTDYFLEPVPQ